jgi:ABC-type Na+ efflux pump permease subunit
VADLRRRVLELLLPADASLDGAVRARWVGVAGIAAAAIGFVAILAALRLSAARGLVVPAQIPTLLVAVPLSAAATTASGVAWVLRRGQKRRPAVGFWSGVAVAVLSHPLAWGAAGLFAGGAEWSGGAAASTVRSLVAVGWFTVPLCAAGGYWVGRRFSGANCP